MWKLLWISKVKLAPIAATLSWLERYSRFTCVRVPSDVGLADVAVITSGVTCGTHHHIRLALRLSLDDVYWQMLQGSSALGQVYLTRGIPDFLS